MKRIPLGNSQLSVSRICMGCMGFGDANNGQHSWTVDEEQTRAIIKRGLELGINFFDTAIAYQSGTSEIPGIVSATVNPTPGVILFPPYEGIVMHAAPTQTGGAALAWLGNTLGRTPAEMSALAAGIEPGSAVPVIGSLALAGSTVGMGGAMASTVAAASPLVFPAASVAVAVIRHVRRLDDYRAQVAAYCDAVVGVFPGRPVRGALLFADGAVVEVERAGDPVGAG